MSMSPCSVGAFGSGTDTNGTRGLCSQCVLTGAEFGTVSLQRACRRVCSRLLNLLAASFSSEVVPVEESIKRPYFEAAMRGAADADIVFVLMHMADTQPEFKTVCR